MITRGKILLLCLISLIAFTAKGQLSANFSASQVTACAPVVIYFTNSSSGATSYTWSFGNSSPLSYNTNPSSSYPNPGTYTVTLTASNGTSTATHSLTITINPPPTVSFTANDTEGCPGLSVSFTNTSVLNAPGAGSYNWNFGDGTSSIAQNPAHPFSTSGYYNITLTVTNSNGCNSTLVKSSYIHIYNTPVPNFSVNSNFFCHSPGNAIFTNTSTGFGTLTNFWKFGDGGTSASINPAHTYNTPGYYNVTLIDTDAHGCIDSLTRANYIFVSSLSGSFSGPPAACIYDSVFFQNTTSQNYVSSAWSFGNGDTSALDSPAYAYPASGTFTVRLIVSDSNCSDTVTHPITIYPEPVATISNPPYCAVPVTVPFTSTAPPGSTYLWSFGDGGSSMLANPSHPFTLDSIDTIKLIVTDIHGCRDTVKKVDTMYKILLNASADLNGGCIPVTFHFFVAADTNNVTHYPFPLTQPLNYPHSPVVSYTWSFGDGSPNSSSASPTHTYSVFGTYTVILSVLYANGCSAADTIQVHAGTPPIPSFTASPTHICADKEVTFTCTSPVFTNVIWHLGDGVTTTDNPEVHKYLMPGIYSVELIVYNNGCPDSITMTNLITVDTGKALLKYVLNCDSLLKVQFYDSSIGATSYIWLFGDGTTSGLPNPLHTYPTYGNYTAALAIYDSVTGCHDTAFAPLSLIKPQPTFVADDTTVCKNAVVHFTSFPNGGRISSFWYSNGIFKDTTANLVDTFFNTGIYSIKYVMLDMLGCFDTATKNNYITVAKPVANFSAVPAQGCKPLNVTFTDLSTDVAGTSITNCLWSFGNNNTASVSLPSTSYTYNNKGVYNIKLIITDNIGCKDTLKIDSLIRVYKPQAQFTVSDTTPCRNQTVNFVNNTLDSLSTALWLFGDGGTSNSIQTSHPYTQNGTFTVTLIVTDIHGCKDTLTKPNYINITTPTASFYMNDSIGICPPLQVYFTNTSTGAVGYYWDFGNGTHSFIQNPGNPYSVPGVYTIMLIASNTQGCADTAYGHATLYGFSGSLSYTPLIGCMPLSVQFTANVSNVPGIIWDFNDGSTSTLSSVFTASHTYTTPGAYVPKLIMSGTGCQALSNGIDTIKVDAVTAGYTTIPFPVCIHDPFNFTDSSHSLFSVINNWTWRFNAGSGSNISNPQHVYDSTGTFSVTLIVKDGVGCMDSLTNNVIVYPLPVLNVSADTIICLGDAAHLNVSGAVSYTWSPASTLSCSNCPSPSASPASPTEYVVTGTDANACKNYDSVHVGLKTKTVSAGIGGEICYGQRIRLLDTGAQSYLWSPAASLDSSQSPNPLASPLANITYTVIARDGTCIPDTNYVTVVVHTLPKVNAGNGVTIIEGNSTVLQATGNNVKNYVWSPSHGLSCDSCTDPTVNIQQTTIFTLTGYSNYGCIDSDKVTVTVLCDKSQVFIPNSFTPNGDGQNDIFYPRGVGIKKINSFRIYDRWGELIFERKDININDDSNSWDGTYKGAKPRPDIYVYVVDAVCESGEEITWKGDVTIIR